MRPERLVDALAGRQTHKGSDTPSPCNAAIRRSSAIAAMLNPSSSPD